MSNAELIKALRCKTNNVNDCTMCDYHNACYDGTLESIAAEVLEEADKRIEKLEKGYSWKAYEALEESIEGYKTRIAELEAQMPKEAHWVAVQNGIGVCSNCNRQDSIDNMATHCRYCGARMKGEHDE